MSEKTMRAARLHTIGGRFQIDQVPIPEVRELDVLVEVKAAGVVPNLRNVVTHFPTWFPYLPLPKLPAIYGLDSAGVVKAVGSRVRTGVKPGDRVYVNPGLSCGTCPACRNDDPVNCTSYTFMGYFGFGPGSQKIYEDYPYGGFGEYLTAPASSLVTLPQSVSFEEAARFGYIGTGYSGLRKARLQAGQTVLVDGGTGTLGVGTVISALAMGASKVFATGRNKLLLEKLKAIDPKRIHTIALGDGPASAAVMKATDDLGVDVVMQALGPSAPASAVVDSIHALKRGGVMVNIGGVSETLPIDPIPMMTQQKSFVGSCWFTTKEGQTMADLADAGLLNLGVFEHERFGLDSVNEALDAVEQRTGGFSNVVVVR
ncbi:alcohol dehydrogenase catalytic domain-containing protein [Variovorax paradoxus]|uniref:Alcohol dehydrogenase catalytic domain-containing protein n=1 Tax=Variovorax paradoxus TaxID=34073 RepID=A0A5Q0M6U0_VARPD|nr:alcohol dehydrogenase catalytic domain-containing protein [Variovorax paradoxus]QFZ85166.1 alcohol dehydrogenase catalytic domain-containing protein [Variovorax paradoxus]